LPVSTAGCSIYRQPCILRFPLAKTRDSWVDVSGGFPLSVSAAGFSSSAVRSCDQHGADADVPATAAVAAVEIDGRLPARSPLQVRVRYIAQRHCPLQIHEAEITSVFLCNLAHTYSSCTQCTYRVWDDAAVYVELVDDHWIFHVGEVYVGEGDEFRVASPTLREETITPVRNSEFQLVGTW
jgi:hypothetical protein